MKLIKLCYLLLKIFLFLFLQYLEKNNFMKNNLNFIYFIYFITYYFYFFFLIKLKYFLKY